MSKCIICNLKQPIFNYEKETKALYCGDCKKDEMVDVKNQKCIKCKVKRANFNYKDQVMALFCGDCKKEEMVDVKHPKCIDCKVKRPTFNYEDKTNPLFCGDCKKDGMIDILTPRCIECKIKVPCFNYDDQTKALFCGDCKKEEMVDVKHLKCIVCKVKTPIYNYENQKRRYCITCKKEGMINVVSPKCIVCNIKLPIFNYPDESKGLYCFDCKEEEMIDVKHRKCVECQEKRPNFNYPEETIGLYCFNCKKHKMVDVMHPKCKTEHCDTRVGSTYQGYCYYCFVHLFPDEPVVKNYKTKENEIGRHLKEIFQNIDCVQDRKIDYGCSKYRPDFFYDLGSHVIIVEVDENQHSSYETSCENRRIMELSQDVQHRPIVFIRFNPDKYKTIKEEKEKTIQGCWKRNNKTGTISIANYKEWNHRLEGLGKEMEYHLETIPSKLITISNLFFDTILN